MVSHSLRNCPKRGSEVLVRYSSTYEKDLSNRPLRERVLLHRTPFPYPQSPRAPRVHPLREILNAIFYVVRSGCAWRLLPHDFPPWKTIHHYFRTWRIDGSWERLHAALRERVRVRMKQEPLPSAGIVDS